MRYKNFKAVAMRCKNKGKPKDVTKDCVSVSVGARTCQFVSFVQTAQILPTDDYKLLKKAQVTFVANVAVRSALLNNSPLDVKRFVIVFECPNAFVRFLVSLTHVFLQKG